MYYLKIPFLNQDIQFLSKNIGRDYMLNESEFFKSGNVYLLHHILKKNIKIPILSKTLDPLNQQLFGFFVKNPES